MEANTQLSLLLSCEHGGNEVPEKYLPYFKNVGDILQTHRGYDIGAFDLFETLKQLNPDYSIFSKTTRLLVDLNRSLHKKTLFSEWTNQLDLREKEQILNTYYHPFRKSFANELKLKVEQGKQILHVSIHSFTPVLNGEVRTTDIGILYHPGRLSEKLFAKVWKEKLGECLPQLRVRFNYPYLGKPDGHVAAHRRIYADHQYVGIELELNQKFAFDKVIYNGIRKSLELSIGDF